MFFVTLLNHVYWVLGAAIGGIFGKLVQMNMEGLSFVMTALFVVIFIEQWMKETRHHSTLVGVGLSLLCLIVFGSHNFIIPAMISILDWLTFMRKPLERAGERRNAGSERYPRSKAWITRHRRCAWHVSKLA